MKQINVLIMFLFFLVFVGCQNNDVKKIYGTWEEIKAPATELDFDNLDDQGNPTIKSIPQKGFLLTFSEKAWKEDDGTELETQYKVLEKGVIAISNNGDDEYAYAKILEGGNLNFCLRVNPQNIIQFKKVE